MNLPPYLNTIPHLSAIARLAQKKQVSVWLVGGFLRDIFLKVDKDLIDFDFCVEKDELSFVKNFSRMIKAKYIVMDKEQGSYRVIVKHKNKLYTYDFTRMRGKTFQEDISLRDFTMNMLAVDLNDKPYQLIDYFGSKTDLKQRILRTVNEEVFFHDPLRILRGFSYMANYGFRAEKKTEKAMIRHKQFIKNVSGERISEELFKMLACETIYPVFKRMSQCDVLEEIIPYIEKGRKVFQGLYHHLDVWDHSLETVRTFENLYQKTCKKHPDIQAYLQEELAQGRRRIQIVKLACLLHDVGKPFAKKRKGKKTIFHTHEKIGRDLAEEIALRLKFSWREKDVLKKLIFWHLRPGYLADQKVPSRRAIYRFFHDTQEEGIGVIVLSISDWRATCGPLIDLQKRKTHEKVMFQLIDTYLEQKKNKPLPVLLNGYDVMRKFNLVPSPLIGEVLKKIKEAQALGEISTKKEAFIVAQKTIVSYKKRPHKNAGDTKCR